MLDPILNFARVEVSIGYNDSATSIVLLAGEGAKLPNPSVDGEFNLVWWDSTNYPNPTDDPNVEIIRVTARSTDTLTVSRNQEGTGASTKNTGGSTYLMILALTKKTYDEISDLKSRVQYADSPMIITGGEIAEGTNAGTFKVLALTAMLRITDSVTGALEEVSLAEQDNQAITAADTTYFVYLNYGGGTPTISISATELTDERNIPIGKVMKDGSDNVHYLSNGFRLQDGVRKLHIRAKELRTIELESGSAIAYSGTNNFTMEIGIAYSGINRLALTAYDSAVTTFIPIRTNGATFIEDTPVNVIDYAHYDSQDGSLGNVGVAKYSVFWIYKHAYDNHVYARYGIDSYSLAAAQAANEPTKPTHLTDFGLLIGKIIAPQAGGSFTDVQMVTERIFTGTAVSDHGNLTGLGDDDHAQYLLIAGTRAMTGNLNMGTKDITSVGSIGATGSRATKAWLIDLEVTNDITIGGTALASIYAQLGANSDITSLTGLTTSLGVAYGGIGRASQTAYAVICGGTTATAAQQSIASVGTADQVLTSNGPGALPTFQDAAGGAAWTLHDTATKTSEDGDHTFSSLPVHDWWKIVFDFQPTTGAGSSFEMTWNNITASNYQQMKVSSGGTYTKSTGRSNISLPSLTPTYTYRFACIITGKHKDGDKRLDSVFGSATLGIEKIEFAGLESDANDLTRIDIIAGANLTGTYKIYYLDGVLP